MKKEISLFLYCIIIFFYNSEIVFSADPPESPIINEIIIKKRDRPIEIEPYIKEWITPNYRCAARWDDWEKTPQKCQNDFEVPEPSFLYKFCRYSVSVNKVNRGAYASKALQSGRGVAVSLKAWGNGKFWDKHGGEVDVKIVLEGYPSGSLPQGIENNIKEYCQNNNENISLDYECSCSNNHYMCTVWENGNRGPVEDHGSCNPQSEIPPPGYPVTPGE